jgi:predicted TIM-barrel fold metal-dependent hydrolase
MRIDSHVCFSESHPPEHLQAILARNKFDTAILVVYGPELPATGEHIAGLIVRDLGHLDEYQKDPRFRGVCLPIDRIDTEAARELARRGLSLDLEMRPAEFPALARIAESHPDLRIVIDHLARPAYHLGLTDEWCTGMQAAALLPNVFCKISGLLTETEKLPWNAQPMRPFVQYALSVFGPPRLMFGSEWPIRLPDVTWKESLAAFTQAIGANPIEVREHLLGGTAAAFYSLA